MQINKHNMILLNKLVEIQSGRQTSVVPAPRRYRKLAKQNASIPRNLSISNLSPPMSHRQRGSVGPSSLNYSVRRKENERIERENHKIAQRLFESKGILNKKVLDTSFAIQDKYRNNITKVKPVKPRYFGDVSLMSKTNRLPPLEQSNTNSMMDLSNSKQNSGRNHAT